MGRLERLLGSLYLGGCNRDIIAHMQDRIVVVPFDASDIHLAVGDILTNLQENAVTVEFDSDKGHGECKASTLVLNTRGVVEFDGAALHRSMRRSYFGVA